MKLALWKRALLGALLTLQASTGTPLTAARRTALGLLAGLAVTLGAVAVPLAGTAHAGGLSGGVFRDGTAGHSAVESRSSVSVGSGSVEAGRTKPGGTGEGIQSFGSKPGLLSGGN
jgi:hypothetical protein